MGSLGEIALRGGRPHFRNSDLFVLASQVNAHLLPDGKTGHGGGRKDRRPGGEVELRPRRHGTEDHGGRGGRSGRIRFQQQVFPGCERGSGREGQGRHGRPAAAADLQFQAGQVGIDSTGVVEFHERIGEADFIDFQGFRAADSGAERSVAAFPAGGGREGSGRAFCGRRQRVKDGFLLAGFQAAEAFPFRTDAPAGGQREVKRDIRERRGGVVPEGHAHLLVLSQSEGRDTREFQGVSLISGRGDVLLHGGDGLVGRVADGHHALVESAGGTVAVVAAVTQQHAAFLVHRIIGVAVRSSGPHAAVEGRHGILRRIRAPEVPLIPAATIDIDRHETPAVDGRDVILLGAVAGEEPRFHVGHDPRAFAVSASPGGGGAVIGSFHRARAHGAAVGGRVAVVEAAAAVEMGSVNYVIHALRLVIDSESPGVVAAIAHSRHDVHAVDLVAVQQHRRHIGQGGVVEASLVGPLEGARRRGQQVIAHAGLVVDHGDAAHRPGEEGVLRRGIGITVLGGPDVDGSPVGVALHTVERSVIAGIEQACGAMGGNTGGAALRIDVTGAGFPSGGRAADGKDDAGGDRHQAE